MEFKLQKPPDKKPLTAAAQRDAAQKTAIPLNPTAPGAEQPAEPAPPPPPPKETKADKVKQVAAMLAARAAVWVYHFARERPRIFASIVAGIVVIGLGLFFAQRVYLDFQRSGALDLEAQGQAAEGDNTANRLYAEAAAQMEQYLRFRPKDLESRQDLARIYTKGRQADKAREIFKALEAEAGTELGSEFHYYYALALLPERLDSVRRMDRALAANENNIEALIARGFLVGDAPPDIALRDLAGGYALATQLEEEDDAEQLVERLSELHKFLLGASAGLFEPVRLKTPAEVAGEYPADGFINDYLHSVYAHDQVIKGQVAPHHIATIYTVLLQIRVTEYGKALEAVEAAAAENPEVLFLQTLHAALMAASGDYTAAADKFEAITAVAGDDSELLTNIANARVAAGDADLAEVLDFYDRAIDILPENTVALNNRGYLRVGGGDVTNARADFEKALEFAPSELAPNLNFGILRLAAGEAKEAVSLLSGVSVIDGGFGDVLVYLGDARLATGDDEEAQRAFQLHREARPTDARGYLRLAAVHRSRGDDLLAVGELQAGLGRLPDHDEMRIALAEALVALGHFDRAEAAIGGADGVRADIIRGDILAARDDLSSAIDIYRFALDDAETPHDRAIIAVRLGGALLDWDATDSEEAFSLAESALEDMPDSPEALAVRARARIVRGESELAILDAKRAAQAAETNFDILVVAGDANANASRYAEALAYYGAALDLNPDSIDALKRIAQTQRDMGRTQTALKTEELIARLSNTYTETRLGGAVISGGRSALEKALNKAIQENRHQDAIALFNKLIEDKLYGEDESLYHTTYQNRGALYLQMRNYVAAAADLEKAISLQSKLGEVNPATAGNLGDAYYKLEKFDKSVEFLTLGLKFQPDNIGWLYTRALSLRRIQGGFEDALADLARVLEIKPNYCPAFNVRGIIFSNAAQNKQGIEEFTKAINCDPKRAAYYRARAALYQLTGQINKASSDLQTAKALGGG